jgi:hypothetical protein
LKLVTSPSGKFRKGVTSLENKPGSGWPNSLDNQELKAFVEHNTCQTSRDMALHFGVSRSTIFWNCEEIIHYSLLKEGKTIDAIKCCIEITKMYRTYEMKYPRIVNRDNLFLLYDSARPHTAVATKQLLKWKNINKMNHDLVLL